MATRLAALNISERELGLMSGFRCIASIAGIVRVGLASGLVWRARSCLLEEISVHLETVAGLKSQAILGKVLRPRRQVSRLLVTRRRKLPRS